MLKFKQEYARISSCIRQGKEESNILEGLFSHTVVKMDNDFREFAISSNIQISHWTNKSFLCVEIYNFTLAIN